MKTCLVPILAAAFGLAPSALALQGQMFDPPLISPAGENPLALASGDLNGDQQIDLVRADRGTPDVHVYFGDGAGGLSPATSYDGAADTRDVDLSDVDMDGHLDVVTIGAWTGELFLLLNDGSGALSTTRSFDIPDGASKMDIADLDHDEDPDVCITLFWTRQVIVMINDGSGNFAASSSYALPLPGADVKLVDLDEDGEPDLVVTCNDFGEGDAVYVFLGDGTGGFGPRADFDVGADCTADLAVADFDGDGFVDVAVGTCAGLAVLTGNGTGALGDATLLTSSAWPEGWAPVPEAADFDGDGRADLAGLVTEPAPTNGIVTIFSRDPPLGWEVDGDYDIADAGGWGAVHAAHLGNEEFPDLLVASAGQLALFTHTALDCNQNGLFDPEEAEDDPAGDVNDNEVPDECECLSESYCQTAPNSAGDGATISFGGTASISRNDFVLLASDCPTNKTGIFFYGPEQDQAVFGDGFRCVFGQIFRLPLVNTGPNGIGAYAIDYNAPPRPGGQITEGSTWNFQFWYRDPLGPGGSGFNLSNGLEIGFCP